MLKQEIICPSCNEQYIVLAKNSEACYCPFCIEPVEVEDQRGELEMGNDENE